MSMKKVVSMMLTCGMILSLLAGCGDSSQSETTDAQKDTEEAASGEAETSDSEESAYPEYLNVESDYPIIKDEYAGTIVIKVVYAADSSAGDFQNTWVAQYWKDKYNVEFEMEPVLSSAVEDKKNILMASGDLPDMIWGFGFSLNELEEYGTQDGLLLAMDEYISEELTPGIQYTFTEDPYVEEVFTSTDGHIYSLGTVTDRENLGDVSNLFFNTTWLDEVGYEIPQTLDELVEVLYAVKEADPAGVGSENVYPFGGNFNDTYHMGYYILNALGYITTDSTGAEAAIRDGEVVIPAYDTEVFKEYLTLMNQFYNDGIITPDYFTIDTTGVTAQINGGQNLIISNPAYSMGLENFQEWESAYPLTSDWQEEKEWMMNSTNYAYPGGAVISADTEYPELCLKILDAFFNVTTDDARAFWMGAGVNSEYNYGYVNEEWDEETLTYYWDDSKFPDGKDLWTYLMQDLTGLQPPVGHHSSTAGIKRHIEAQGYDYPDEETFNLEDGDQHYRSTVYTNCLPYVTDRFPTNFYLDDEANARYTDLTTVIEPYIEEQVALFITGERPISEINDFKAELESMGIEELMDIYTGIYN